MSSTIGSNSPQTQWLLSSILLWNSVTRHGQAVGEQQGVLLKIVFSGNIGLMPLICTQYCDCISSQCSFENIYWHVRYCSIWISLEKPDSSTSSTTAPFTPHTSIRGICLRKYLTLLAENMLAIFSNIITPGAPLTHMLSGKYVCWWVAAFLIWNFLRTHKCSSTVNECRNKWNAVSHIHSSCLWHRGWRCIRAVV